MKKKKLVRKQLQISLDRVRPLLELSAPSKGWIRAIRDALGMSARQLADRMGVAQQSVARIEKDESSGSITIKTMRRIAECLDCAFVYGFVPRTTLEEIVRRQAEQVAINRLNRASQTMKLEGQGLETEENEKILSDMIEEIINELPANLWDQSS